ncbi:hypothetical protein C9J03_26260 [Photobacterium gaetbulicola]|uniref:Uncharacterized protein n=1 Tax=Photobacterium gaetbulicola Gung47 TaxID=658445 RepID=A0A0C5WTS9_9GAMM|nr:hypothetical protein [Photobacterium gaetbulicola]AJR06222.1 hypothetical protein H744_1c1197 [Photobacterium gaetbulicola Gung47]AJR06455.1 hypothetical protein H744_1c1433 [Photobacterium gaetbulicola Gung47]AJR08804.1 hypothetical protein H744_2c2140 [Photobacterium gaetbulicola Gung47]PST98362.1 hypothetical protein C9J03_26260 [Photobacterium gaetbulicola]
MQNHDKLSQAIAAFEHWRQTRPNKHVNIPDQLRLLALELLEEYRIGQVTNALRICTTQLNSWRQLLPTERPVPDFIPLQIESDLQHNSGLNLQVTLPNSSQIRIYGDISPGLLRVLMQEAGEYR